MPSPRTASVVKIVITLLILAFSIYFSVYNVDFAELGRSFSTANYWLPLSMIPVAIASFHIRALRWKVIIRTMHPEVRLSSLTAGVIVGYFMNNIIPRSGELARPWLTAQRESGTTFTGLLGTIVVERFIDVICLLLMIVSILAFDDKLFVGFEDYGLTTASVLRALYPMVGLGVVFLLVAPTKAGYRVAEWVTRPLPPRFRDRVLGALRQLLTGFGAIRTVSQAVQITFWSILLYVIYTIPIYVMFFAFPAESAVSATFFDGVKVLALTSIAFAVAPTPGAFGVFHVTARIAVIRMLNFSVADAVAYAAITHIISYATTMVVGGYHLVVGNVRFGDLMSTRQSD